MCNKYAHIYKNQKEKINSDWGWVWGEYLMRVYLNFFFSFGFEILLLLYSTSDSIPFKSYFALISKRLKNAFSLGCWL